MKHCFSHACTGINKKAYLFIFFLIFLSAASPAHAPSNALNDRPSYCCSGMFTLPGFQPYSYYLCPSLLSKSVLTRPTDTSCLRFSCHSIVLVVIQNNWWNPDHSIQLHSWSDVACSSCMPLRFLMSPIQTEMCNRGTCVDGQRGKRMLGRLSEDSWCEVTCRGQFPYVIFIPEPCEPLQMVHSWLDEQPKGTPERQRHRGRRWGAGDKEQFAKNAAWLESSTHKVQQPKQDAISTYPAAVNRLFACMGAGEEPDSVTRSKQNKGGSSGPSFFLRCVTSLLLWMAIVHSWVILACVSISSSWFTAHISDSFEGRMWIKEL